MESSASLNVDISKFLAPGTKREDLQEEISSLALMDMIEQGHQTDITLITPSGSVKAHRCFLAAVSPVINAMENPTSTLELPYMTLDGLQLFLVLLYIVPDHQVAMSEFQAAVDRHFVEIFEACHRYQVIRLITTLNDGLPRNMTPENCWDFKKISLAIQEFRDQREGFSRQNYVNLYTTWCCYVMENCDKVMKSDRVEQEMQQDPATVKYFMQELTMLLKEVLPRNEDGSESSVVIAHWYASRKRRRLN